MGATRLFVFRRADDPSVRATFAVRHGDVLHMHADCQEHWQHSVVREQPGSGGGARGSAPSRDAPLADAARQLQQQRWQAAHAATSALLGRTSAFLEQLQADLDRLRQQLACCATAHAAPPSYHLRSALLLALGAAVLGGATVWLASPGRKKPGHRRQ